MKRQRQRHFTHTQARVALNLCINKYAPVQRCVGLRAERTPVRRTCFSQAMRFKAPCRAKLQPQRCDRNERKSHARDGGTGRRQQGFHCRRCRRRRRRQFECACKRVHTRDIGIFDDFLRFICFVCLIVRCGAEHARAAPRLPIHTHTLSHSA